MKKETIVYIIIGIILIAIALWILVPTLTGKAVLDFNTCQDTDSGIDISSKGAVSGTFNSISEVKYAEEDICIDDKRLLEWYCLPNSIRESKIYPCSNSCEDGRCLGE